MYMGTRRNYQHKTNGNDSPLHVLPVAANLIDYTLELTDNVKHFPKKVRFSIVNRIQDRVLAIRDDLVDANEIYPILDEQDKVDRLKLQRRALTGCKKLLYLIELSKKRGYIDKGTFDYWTKLTLDVKFMTAAWYKAEQSQPEEAEKADAGQDAQWKQSERRREDGAPDLRLHRHRRRSGVPGPDRQGNRDQRVRNDHPSAVHSDQRHTEHGGPVVCMASPSDRDPRPENRGQRRRRRVRHPDDHIQPDRHQDRRFPRDQYGRDGHEGLPVPVPGPADRRDPSL